MRNLPHAGRVTVFCLPLSQGSLDNLLTKASQKAQGVYEQIRQNIANSTVVGSDETSAKVNGNKWWIWVWQNVQNTFIVAAQDQGFATILALTIDNQKYPLTATFQLSIIKNRNYLLPFLYNLDIPPDNNGSERAIRNIKVKQKISGQFKSGQNTFCVLRSVIDTFIKRKLNVFNSLFQIMNLVPE